MIDNVADVRRIKTNDLYRYVSSIKGEKHIAVESLTNMIDDAIREKKL